MAEEKGDWSLSPGLERDEVGDMRDEFVSTYHKQAMLKKISNRSPHTVTLGGFLSASWGGPTFQATAGGCKKRDGKEDAPEGRVEEEALGRHFLPLWFQWTIHPRGVEARHAGG